jgi:2-polyprenyl-3-methyl-5-hydroxy-6-metoxy-1,4-benzoquinol methylase
MSELAKWQNRYANKDTPWDTGHPSTELQRVIAEENIQACRVIELGCGTGTNAVWLASQGFEVTAVDLSPLAVGRAQERAVAAGVHVRFLTADVLNPPDLGGPFEFFFDRGCYHVVRRVDAPAFLQTLRKISWPGTTGLILAGNAREPHDPGPPVVTEEEIRAELGSLFDIVWLREIRFDQAEEGGLRFLGWSCSLRRSA